MHNYSFKEALLIAKTYLKQGFDSLQPEVKKTVIETILSVSNRNSRNLQTVAHAIAQEGYIFTDFEILKIKDKFGWTVAHELAKRGCVFTDPEIWKLSDKTGLTVVHIIAEKACKSPEILKEIASHPEIIELSTRDGYTVAHAMAKAGYIFHDPEIWVFRNKKGWTVAHIMAERGYKFTDPRILNLITRDGWSVTDAMILGDYLKARIASDTPKSADSQPIFKPSTEENNPIVSNHK